MRIPNSINVNTLKAYEIHPRSIPKERRLFESFNFERWDEQTPKTLQEICVEAIAKNWEEHPILDEIAMPVDRYLLLDLLGTDLPLPLTIPRINDDVYWKRSYTERWPLCLPHHVKPLEIFEILRTGDLRRLSGVYSPSGSNGNNSVIENLSEKCTISNRHVSKRNVRALDRLKEKSKGSHKQRTWKEYYIEMHIKEYFEALEPENYDPEKIKELSDLCSPYIKSLKIEHMQCAEDSESKIPLNAILTGFQNLEELSLCFKQTYVGEEFSWNVLKTSYQDIRLLTKGLEKLRLQVLRIRNSDIDCEKLMTILKSLLKHELKVLDFSHCNVADRGAIALSKFSLYIPIKQLILTNNKIGSKGIKCLSHALCQDACQISELDLHLNPIGNTGGNLLFQALIVGAKNLKSLLLSGCGFSEDISVGEMLEMNNSLEAMDISCNNIHEEGGQKILAAMQRNSKIKKLDLKMCKVSSETEFAIYQLVYKNRKTRKPTVTGNSEMDIEKMKQGPVLSDELLVEFEKILQ